MLTALLWVAIITAGFMVIGPAFLAVGWILRIVIGGASFAVGTGGWLSGLLDPREPTLPQSRRNPRKKRGHTQGRATRKRG